MKIKGHLRPKTQGETLKRVVKKTLSTSTVQMVPALVKLGTLTKTSRSMN